MNEIQPNQRNEDRERVKRHVAELGEFFDTVQIFVSKHATGDGGTFTSGQGSGNWCARYGQITEWVKYEDERIRECARKQES